MGIIMVAACFIFGFNCIKGAFDTPLAQWGFVQVLLIIVGLALFVLGVFRGMLEYRIKKAKTAKEAEEKELEEAAKPEVVEIVQKEEDELAYLDEMDEEEKKNNR